MENELIPWDKLSYEIEQAKDIVIIQRLEVKLEAYQKLAKQDNASLETQNTIAEYRLKLKRQKGDWLNENVPHGGERGNQYTGGKFDGIDLGALGIKKDESANSRRIAEMPEELFNEIVKETKASNKELTTSILLTEAKKYEREQSINKQREEINNGLEFPDGLFEVVVIDPPWNYGRDYDPNSSRVANPYPEMSIEQIKDIELPLKEHGFVFLWTTHRFLPDSFDILFTWGIDYKATLVWNKMNLGMGAWFRMQCEFCLFGVKGSPLWLNTTERDIINEPGREHSRKPEAFYLMVEKLCIGRKLDYFSRSERHGWASYGNRINQFYEGE